jgi:transcriptional regulator with XRE-family HTH domain
MGQRPRSKPQYLPAKLLAIRKKLHASQSQMAKLLELSPARVSEYEHGVREPTLLTLLRYARVGDVSTDILIDDELELSPNCGEMF